MKETPILVGDNLTLPQKGQRIHIKPVLRLVGLAGMTLKGGLDDLGATGVMTHVYGMAANAADHAARRFYAYEFHVRPDGADADVILTRDHSREALTSVCVVTEEP
jgi:hypothetical protein